MSKALSVDLRIQVLGAVAAGLTHRQIGEPFDVRATSVSRWRRRECQQGDVRPDPLGGDRRSHVGHDGERDLGPAAEPGEVWLPSRLELETSSRTGVRFRLLLIDTSGISPNCGRIVRCGAGTVTDGSCACA